MFYLSGPYRIRVSRPKSRSPWKNTYVFRYSRWWSYQKNYKRSLYHCVSRIGMQENPIIKSKGRLKPKLEDILLWKKHDIIMNKRRRLR